jgi:hypothetical protein
MSITHNLRPGAGYPVGTNYPHLDVKAGTNGPVAVLWYDASTDETWQWTIVADGYTSGNLTIRIFWYADTASSGNVMWGARIAAITPNTDTQDIETKSFATANTQQDTHLGTTGQREHSVDITVSNLDSLAAGDIVFVQIYRDADGTAGTDDMTGDAGLTHAQVIYS